MSDQASAPKTVRDADGLAAAALISEAIRGTPAPEVHPMELAAQRFYAQSREPAQPAYAQPTAAAAPAPAVAPVASPKPQEPAAPARTVEDVASSFYGVSATTRGMVDWDEPAAAAGDYQLEAPADVLDSSAEGQAAMQRLREGFEAVGVGKSLAAELFGDAVAIAQNDRRRVSQEDATVQLRQQLGSRYDASIAAARDLVQRAAVKSPEIIAFLERTGLGNSPELILKLAKAAEAPPVSDLADLGGPDEPLEHGRAGADVRTTTPGVGVNWGVGGFY